MANPRQVLSPLAQDCPSAQAKESQVRTAEALWNAHSAIKQLSEVCREFGDAMIFESMRTSELQTHLGAAHGAPEAQHALQNARCTRLAATSAALAASADAMLDQLEPLRAPGVWRSGSH